MNRIPKTHPTRGNAAFALLERELAYYHSDAPFLSVEKAAERCQRLSELLTAVAVLQSQSPENDPRVTL